MNIAKFSVSRPIAITVLMMLIVLFGYVSIMRLPIREYPNIEAPTISIITNYVGASSSIVEHKITQIIENAVSGIEGLDNIQSTSKDGKSSVQLEFSIDRDMDAASNDVRDRIMRALNKLPQNAETPIIKKYDTNNTPVMIIAVTTPHMTPMELSDYVNRYVIDRFSVLEGVASVNMIGQFEQSMRIWLHSKEMASRQITATDVENALKTENVDYSAGRIESVSNEYPVSINSQFTKPEDFKKIVIKKDGNGHTIKIGDIASINVEPKTQRNFLKANGETVIAFDISKQSVANTLSISKNARQLADVMAQKLPKDMKLTVLRDEALFIQQSIKEVFFSMMMAAILVFGIVFVFIGSIRAAIIPTITVPISIIGTCIVMDYFHYSINMLTLLAMVLSIGIVVDDAILVLENIQRRIDGGESPLEASICGSKQVFFAVISTTVVLLSAFLPICMFPGKTGKLFAEFSVSMSASVCFSSLVALTLTPMLCNKLLRNQTPTRFIITIDNIVSKAKNFYHIILLSLINHSKYVIAIFVVLALVTAYLFQILPGEYEPKEDRNFLTLKFEASPGIGFFSMTEYMQAALEKINPLLKNKIAKTVLASIPGFGSGSDGVVNTGAVMIELVDKENRKSSVFTLAKKLKNDLKQVPGLKCSPAYPMGIGSKGSSALQFVLGGYDYEELVKWRDIIFDEAAKYHGIVDIDSDYKETYPKLRVDIDKERAGELGISAQNVGATLEIMLSSKNVTTFVDRGQEYDVVLQADSSDRSNINDISNMYVRSQTNNTIVPLDSIIMIKESGESNKLGRQNRARSITISGNVAAGYSISDAIKFLEKVVQEKLPPYAQIYYRGQSKDYKDSESGMFFVLILSILVSYCILSAQFESFKNPLIVMCTIPLGMFGAIFMMWVFGYTINIYTQIGIIMLIGLSAKHGILIVEFANQLRDSGMHLQEAILEAAKLRLRPIIMTGISTVVGAVPLLLATGAGSVSRQNIGLVEVCGGISGIVLTLIFIPIGYMMINKKD